MSRRALLFFCMILVSGPAWGQPATEPSRPTLGDICKFTLNDGRLRLHLTADVQSQGSPLTVEGPHGSGQWQVTLLRDPQGAILQLQMHSTHARPDGGMDRVDVFLFRSQQLSISRRTVDAQGVTQITSVSFQSLTPHGPAEDFVGGRVNEQVLEISGRQPRILVQEQAPDLHALLDRKTDRKDDLVGLLRGIGVPVLIAPDPSEAFEVFQDRWPVDEKVAAEVRSLLPALGSDRYDQREAASAQIRSMGRPAALAIARIDRKELSPEQIARLDAAVAPLHPLTDARAKARKTDVDFLLGCLLSADRSVRVEALKQLEVIAGHKIEFAVDASADDRAAAAETMREGLTDTSPTTAPAK